MGKMQTAQNRLQTALRKTFWKAFKLESEYQNVIRFNNNENKKNNYIFNSKINNIISMLKFRNRHHF